jgi:hypothetical protein
VFTALGTSRVVALGSVAVGALGAFAWLHDETGSAAFAISGACMTALLLLLPLRCQIDPCAR